MQWHVGEEERGGDLRKVLSEYKVFLDGNSIEDVAPSLVLTSRRHLSFIARFARQKERAAQFKDSLIMRMKATWKTSRTRKC